MTGIMTMLPDSPAASERLLYDNPSWYARMFPDPDHDKARFLDALIRRFGGGRRILDVGCGLGQDLGWLIEHGYEGVGVDSHPDMLEYARERYPNVRFEAGRMEELALGAHFEVVTCVGSALLQCWSNEALDATFRRFRAHLVDDGLLILDMRNGAYFLGNAAASAWLDQEHISTAEVDGRTLRAVARFRIVHEAQLLARVREWQMPNQDEPIVEHAAWRLLMPQELRYLLCQAGFEPLALFDDPTPYVDGWDQHPMWSTDAAIPTRVDGTRLFAIARAAAPAREAGA
jgi:SAM-dependent methyltransferase